MVWARCQGKSNTNISQEEQNHPSLNEGCILRGEIACLRHSKAGNQGTNQECAIDHNNGNHRRFKHIEHVQRIQNKHYCKRDGNYPRNTFIGITDSGVTVNKNGLEHHKKAYSKQHIISAMFNETSCIMEDLEANICT